ncbi:DOPA 4,5-dioxygenase family protein [Marinobacterium arenosum]|uniref:DOPA 4,5-dioxygenase family protein n=1 Tax=Marinobacterium arenosum TaxID=2862496 RepID=UPI001C983B1B|nr:DOPA 4,5-dioxygenase family protein [Marinobacterium arenosum]MBY4675791.1 DOPA 4,5-dioxygenase family protein [Marinobacterium arenosum]
MVYRTTEKICGYHAHVYFDEQQYDQAQALCEAAAERFDLVMGRMHREPVGPHPTGSCQLAFGPAVFAELVPWLALNHGELTVLIHTCTGDDLPDHRDHALWLGKQWPLNLAALQS